MNDRNEEDVSKYTDVRHCDYLVDVEMPSVEATELEPKFVGSKEWEEVTCKPFLDAGSTGLVGRLGWMPEWEGMPGSARRVWGRYCLLKRRKAAEVGGLREGGVEGVGLRPGIETLL